MIETLYQNVVDAIIARIADGDLTPGAMLPSETDLAQEFGVSQGTVRRALTLLEQRGALKRRQGVGTFVAVRTPESALFHFFRLRDPSGARSAPELVSEEVARRPATDAERSMLYGEPSEIFEITRVRSLEGRRALFERSFVPAPLFPGLSDRGRLPNALYVLFQQSYGCVIVRADERIGARAAGDAAGAALGVDVQTPVLEIERLAFDLTDRAVERRVSICVTDPHRYEVSLS